jgi:NhaP-type Na+/H+ or K+/H+ antiporter
VLGVDWISPIDDSALFERTSELAVIIALFATGLKLERELRPGAWSAVARLLCIAMPLTIAVIALFGWGVMGLSTGAALVLGAALAPTDPVLAGDIGVGPPGEEEERDPNFSITGEAGLNDGLAFPFVFLGVFVAQEDGYGWVGEWVLADLVYGIVAGVVVGAVVGYGIAALAVWLRDRQLLAHELDGWLAIAAVLVVYGLTEIVGAYGFLAAFAGGVAFRRYEHGHEYNRRVHDGAEVVEKFAELAMVLLLASAVNLTGLGEPGLAGWLLVPLLLLVVRPVAVLVALARTRMGVGERAFVAWFGVRGIGSLYYAAAAIGLGVLSLEEARVLFWTVAGCIIVSIVVHGVTATPLSRRWLEGHKRARKV